MHHFWQIKKQQGAAPALHPTLVALFIVLESGADLFKSGRNHPNHRSHKYYDPSANFPNDISNLLPSSEHCWWDVLGRSYSLFSGSFSQLFPAADVCQRRTELRASVRLRRVRLILPNRPNEDKDIEMEVDKLADDDYVPVSSYLIALFPPSHYSPQSSKLSQPPVTAQKAADQVTRSRKRKSSTSLRAPGSTKRHSSSSQREPESEEAAPLLNDDIRDDEWEVSGHLFHHLTAG